MLPSPLAGVQRSWLSRQHPSTQLHNKQLLGKQQQACPVLPSPPTCVNSCESGMRRSPRSASRPSALRFLPVPGFLAGMAGTACTAGVAAGAAGAAAAAGLAAVAAGLAAAAAAAAAAPPP